MSHTTLPKFVFNSVFFFCYWRRNLPILTARRRKRNQDEFSLYKRCFYPNRKFLRTTVLSRSSPNVHPSEHRITARKNNFMFCLYSISTLVTNSSRISGDFVYKSWRTTTRVKSHIEDYVNLIEYPRRR